MFIQRALLVKLHNILYNVHMYNREDLIGRCERATDGKREKSLKLEIDRTHKGKEGCSIRKRDGKLKL